MNEKLIIVFGTILGLLMIGFVGYWLNKEMDKRLKSAKDFVDEQYKRMKEK